MIWLELTSPLKLTLNDKYYLKEYKAWKEK